MPVSDSLLNNAYAENDGGWRWFVGSWDTLDFGVYATLINNSQCSKHLVSTT